MQTLSFITSLHHTEKKPAFYSCTHLFFLLLTSYLSVESFHRVPGASQCSKFHSEQTAVTDVFDKSRSAASGRPATDTDLTSGPFISLCLYPVAL